MRVLLRVSLTNFHENFNALGLSLLHKIKFKLI